MSKVALTVPEAARVASVKAAVITAAVREGALAARRVDDKVVILRSDLKKWAEALPNY